MKGIGKKVFIMKIFKIQLYFLNIKINFILYGNFNHQQHRNFLQLNLIIFLRQKLMKIYFYVIIVILVKNLSDNYLLIKSVNINIAIHVSLLLFLQFIN